MSNGVNKVILIGRLGQDPETKYSASGAAITNVSVATSESWKDKQTGQQQERTEWHRVVFFNRLAEIAGQYLKKGSKVYIEGSLKTDKWKDQNGQDRQSTNIVASEMQMLDNRDQTQNAPQQQLASSDSNHDRSKGGLVESDTMNSERGKERFIEMDSFDDDIPF